MPNRAIARRSPSATRRRKNHGESLALTRVEVKISTSFGNCNLRIGVVAMSRHQLHVWNESSPLIKVVFSSDGACIVAMNDHGKILGWNVQTAAATDPTTLTYKFKSRGHAPYSPDGRFMFVGYPDYTVHIWDLRIGQRVSRTLRGHKKKIESIDVSPTGKWILTSSQDTTVRLWDFQSGAELDRFDEHRNHVSCVSFALTDDLAVSAGKDATVRLWKLS